MRICPGCMGAVCTIEIYPGRLGTQVLWHALPDATTTSSTEPPLTSLGPLLPARSLQTREPAPLAFVFAMTEQTRDEVSWSLAQMGTGMLTWLTDLPGELDAVSWQLRWVERRLPDQRADELASAYLLLRVQEGYSPWTLPTERSALRLFFGSPLLAEQVLLPPRHREDFRRSRQSPVHEEQSSPHFQPKHWQPLLDFLRVTGLRRREVRMLRVGQIQEQPDGHVVIHVQGKGGKVRQVPVIAGQEATVLSLVQGRNEKEKVFAHIPSHLDIHAYRRHYAQALYQQLSGLPLPPAAGRLPRGILDEQAVLAVSRALGHNRRDVVLTSYLR